MPVVRAKGPGAAPAGQPGYLQTQEGPGPVVARAVQRGADEVGVAFQQRYAREDAVAAAQARVKLQSELEGALRDADSSNAFLTKDGLEGYSNKVAEIRDRVIGETKFNTPDAETNFQAMATGLGGQFGSVGASKAVKAQEDAVNVAADQFVNEWSGLVENDPSNLEDAQAALDEYAKKQYAPAMGPEQENAFKANAMQRFARGAVAAHLAAGDYKGARAVLDLPNVKPHLGDAASGLRMQIISSEAKSDQIRQTLQTKEDAYRQMTGMEPDAKLSPDVALALQGITMPSQTKWTPQDYLGFWKKTHPGQEPDEKTLSRIMNMGGLSTKSSMKERLRAAISANLPDFAAGTLSDSEDVQYQMQLMEWLQQDPLTKVRGKLPPDISEALIHRGYDPQKWMKGMEKVNNDRRHLMLYGDLPSKDAELPDVQGTAPNGTDPKTRLGEVTDDLARQTDIAQQTGMFDPQSGALLTPGGKTLFEASDLLTGIGPSVGRAVSSVVGVGKALPAPQMNQMRTFFEMFKENIITSLQDNPKFAEGERDALRKRMQALETSFLTEPRALRDHIIGLDDYLAVREAQARKTVEQAQVGTDDYTHALQIANVLQGVRQVLGVPVRAPTVDAYRQLRESGALNPGDPFIGQDGRVRYVPGGTQQTQDQNAGQAQPQGQ